MNNITLEILGLATLSLGEYPNAIKCIAKVPKTIAGRMTPSDCVPSDGGATFSIVATKSFRDACLTRGDVVGTLASPIWVSGCPGIYYKANQDIPTGSIVWIGNEKAKLGSGTPVFGWDMYGISVRYAEFQDRGMDGTDLRRIDIPVGTSATTNGGPVISKDKPQSLHGLSCVYRVHYADGTSRVLLRGIIRSYADSGDMVSISISSEISVLGSQKWVAPRSLPTIGWDYMSNGFRRSSKYEAWAGGAYISMTPTMIDILSQGTRSNILIGLYDNQPPSGVPVFTTGMGTSLPSSWDDYHNPPLYNQAPPWGVDPREWKLVAFFGNGGNEVFVYDGQGGTPEEGRGTLDEDATSSTDAFFIAEAVPTSPYQDWRTPGAAGELGYSFQYWGSSAQNDFLARRDVFRTLDGVFSSGDGWMKNESLEYVAHVTSGQIVPLPYIVLIGTNIMDYFEAQTHNEILPNIQNSYCTSLPRGRIGWGEMAPIQTKIINAVIEYIQVRNATTPSSPDIVAATRSILCDTTEGLTGTFENTIGGCIPIEYVWGRTLKDTFFSDMWAQFAVIFVPNGQGGLRPLWLGDDLSTTTGPTIGIADVRDKDHTVQVGTTVPLGSVTYSDLPEIYAYAMMPPDKITIQSEWSGMFGFDGEAVSIPASTYLRRDPWSLIRRQNAPYTGKFSPIDVSVACWDRAVKNYGKAFPSVVLVVSDRYLGMPGDIVEVSLPNMPNPSGGVGVTNLLAQIWERGENTEQGTAEIKLLLVGWYDD